MSDKTTSSAAGRARGRAIDTRERKSSGQSTVTDFTTHHYQDYCCHTYTVMCCPPPRLLSSPPPPPPPPNRAPIGPQHNRSGQSLRRSSSTTLTLPASFHLPQLHVYFSSATKPAAIHPPNTTERSSPRGQLTSCPSAVSPPPPNCTAATMALLLQIERCRTRNFSNLAASSSAAAARRQRVPEHGPRSSQRSSRPALRPLP